MNPFNRNKYVLVYDNGQVYCSFDPHFLDSFAKTTDEWGRSMLIYAKWTKWTAGRTPSTHWKDPKVVANEPFLSSGHGDEEEAFFKKKSLHQRAEAELSWCSQ